jgi:hypothetical protein
MSNIPVSSSAAINNLLLPKKFDLLQYKQGDNASSNASFSKPSRHRNLTVDYRQAKW